MEKKWNIKFLNDELAMAWAKKSCWSMGEALWLLSGFVPEAENTRDVLPDPDIAIGPEVDVLHRAVLAGDLKSLGQNKNGESVFRPADIVNSDLKLIQFCREQRFKSDTPPNYFNAPSLYGSWRHA